MTRSGVPSTTLRLGARTMADLEALAAAAGTISQAVRESVAYWCQAVREAGLANEREFGEADWIRLAHLNHPDPFASHDEDARAAVVDWPSRLAAELVGAWEGRDASLPYHREEKAACLALADRVAALDQARGYAMFACLRWFWDTPGVRTPAAWWRVEVWTAPAGEGQGDAEG